jgi:hypothetical protein
MIQVADPASFNELCVFLLGIFGPDKGVLLRRVLRRDVQQPAILRLDNRVSRESDKR